MHKKILIIGPSWVGDMIMAQSLFIKIKDINPDAIIDVLAPAWSRPILERMPEVNQALDLPIGHGVFGLKSRRHIGRQLRQHQYTQSIVLPNSWKSALIPWFARIPLRTGWRGEMRYGLLNDLRVLEKETLPLMVQRFVSLATPVISLTYSNPHLIINNARLPELLQHYQLDRQRPTLVLCPGAEFGPAKQWPAAHYAEVSNAMIAQGWQVWVMGSASDAATAENILAGIEKNHSDDIKNLCGQTTLEDAIDLMATADQVISNDSGLMHLAAALQKPLIALYGPTSPAFTPPLSEQAKTLSIKVECGPCFQRDCPEKHHRCMQDLSPEQVLAALVDQ